MSVSTSNFKYSGNDKRDAFEVIIWEMFDQRIRSLMLMLNRMMTDLSLLSYTLKH